MMMAEHNTIRTDDEIADCLVFALVDVFHHRPPVCWFDLSDFTNHLVGLVASHHLGGIRLIAIQNRSKN